VLSCPSRLSSSSKPVNKDDASITTSVIGHPTLNARLTPHLRQEMAEQRYVSLRETDLRSMLGWASDDERASSSTRARQSSSTCEVEKQETRRIARVDRRLRQEKEGDK